MKSVFLDSFINRHFWLSYARIRVIFTASSKADDIVRLMEQMGSEDEESEEDFFEDDFEEMTDMEADFISFYCCIFYFLILHPSIDH